MTFAGVPLHTDPFYMHSCFGNDESIAEQSYNYPIWQTTQYYIHPSSWASLSSTSLTTESTSTQDSYYSTIPFEFPNLTGIPETAASSTVLSSIQQPPESYTIQQYSEPDCPAQEVSTAYNITPTYVGNQENHVNPAYPTVSDLNRAPSTPEPARGILHERKPRGRRPISDKRGSQKASAKVDKSKNGRASNRLERNRSAAARYRGRSQHQTDALALYVESLEDQHRQLSSQYNDLVEQVFQLKSEILSHVDCSCVLIHQYVKNEAQKAVDSQVLGGYFNKENRTFL
ncbi:uncharacterized protein B0J16DRAFT_364028 [Fusarium flagelliforme]|uniref:uncharacterized protein n=1 Tax=Fusarium flagelliforme TaxID=2675880 RepID=UPI001E8ED36E|nr:uncharacterized protein B0J16DRAFT_364028 [Fusarium flagelliforme]KAH7179054.1 hypothetical protein B0J16DRAFT_364028 [Fusarium flagelliforme]